MTRDYYRVLEVNRLAKDFEIQSAYRRLALKFHPCVNAADPNASTIFNNLAEAYDILSDCKKRAIYDQYGEEGLRNGIPIGHDWIEGYVFHGDAEKVFRDFFGGDNPFKEFYTRAEEDRAVSFGGLDGRGRIKKDLPIVRDLLLSLDDCYHGAIKKIKISRRILSDDGATSSIREKILSITVKRGLLPDTKIIFEGEGDQGPNNIPSDLIFIVKDKPHPYFYREQADLIHTAKISLGYALIGITLHIEHLDGRLLDIPINEIVRPGYKKRLPGHGMPFMNDPDKYGDLIIQFNVDYPFILNPDQKLFIKEALINNQLHLKKHQQQNHRKKNIQHLD